MTDEPIIDPCIQGELFLASLGEMATRCRLLETENKAMAEQVEALTIELDRVNKRVQLLTAQRDSAMQSDTTSKNLLEELAQRLLAGMKVIRPPLRGAPPRPDERNVVRMGPAA